MLGWLLHPYVQSIFAPPREPSRLERLGAQAMRLHEDVRDAAELFCMVVPENVPGDPAKGE